MNCIFGRSVNGSGRGSNQLGVLRLADNIFQIWFGKDKLNGAYSPEPQGAPFHSLYSASVTFGAIAYRILFMLVLYTCVITVLLHLAKYVLSQNPQAQAEAKGKVMRVFIIALFSGMIVSIIALIVAAFAV